MVGIRELKKISCSRPLKFMVILLQPFDLFSNYMDCCDFS
jgi:hypothetical protein